MRKFEFKLQKLLDIRLRREEQEKIELAKASGDYQREQGKKDKVLANLVNYRKELYRPDGNPDFKKLRLYDLMIRDSDIMMDKLDEVIEEKRIIMLKHIDKYAELKKERRSVEILREKALKRYEEASRKEEQSTSDEIGKNLFLNNKGGGNFSDNQKGREI